MLVGEAYTVSLFDTMPAEPTGWPALRTSIEAIHDTPSPANSLGAATTEQSRRSTCSPNVPSAASSNNRGIQ